MPGEATGSRTLGAELYSAILGSVGLDVGTVIPKHCKSNSVSRC